MLFVFLRHTTRTTYMSHKSLKCVFHDLLRGLRNCFRHSLVSLSIIVIVVYWRRFAYATYTHTDTDRLSVSNNRVTLKLFMIFGPLENEKRSEEIPRFGVLSLQTTTAYLDGLLVLFFNFFQGFSTYLSTASSSGCCCIIYAPASAFFLPDPLSCWSLRGCAVRPFYGRPLEMRQRHLRILNIPFLSSNLIVWIWF